MGKVIVIEGRRKSDGMPLRIELDNMLHSASWTSSYMNGEIGFELSIAGHEGDGHTVDGVYFEDPRISGLDELEDVRVYLERSENAYL